MLYYYTFVKGKRSAKVYMKNNRIQLLCNNNENEIFDFDCTGNIYNARKFMKDFDESN